MQRGRHEAQSRVSILHGSLVTCSNSLDTQITLSQIFHFLLKVGILGGGTSLASCCLLLYELLLQFCSKLLISGTAC
jgi:hypothetical protein